MSEKPYPPAEVDVNVDARGLKCPEPLMLVRNKMMDMESGQIIKILATDPSTSWDFPNFCKFLSHEMLHSDTEDGEYQYWIRKK
ncbi:MAG: tRNA 2-thiouridine synthesizing protein A [Flavobacterium sp.]|jgi:tRNA 2-thiouridine synthesizing protein A